MRPIIKALSNASSGVLYSPALPLDVYQTPFNISIQVRVTGIANYTVQYTFDSIFANGYNPATGNWTNHSQLTAQTTTADSNIAFPCTAIRLMQSTGTGATTITVIQAGGS